MCEMGAFIQHNFIARHSDLLLHVLQVPQLRPCRPGAYNHVKLRPAINSCNHVGLHVVFFLASKFCAEPPPSHTHTQSVPLSLIPGLTPRMKKKEGQTAPSYASRLLAFIRKSSCAVHSLLIVLPARGFMSAFLSRRLCLIGPVKPECNIYDDHVDRRTKRGRPYETG